MRVTLVTETYFPQVNGVSRTLGQLVRHLKEAGDDVQVVHPDYGAVERPGRHVPCPLDQPCRSTRSCTCPCRRSARPTGRSTRSGPTWSTSPPRRRSGLSVLRHARRRQVPVVSSFHTNFDQYSDHYGVGWARGTIWRYLRWFHNRTRETYVPSRTTIAELEARGFERLVLWPRGVDSRLFRPDRPGRDRGAARPWVSRPKTS